MGLLVCFSGVWSTMSLIWCSIADGHLGNQLHILNWLRFPFLRLNCQFITLVEVYYKASEHQDNLLYGNSPCIWTSFHLLYRWCQKPVELILCTQQHDDSKVFPFPRILLFHASSFLDAWQQRCLPPPCICFQLGHCTFHSYWTSPLLILREKSRKFLALSFWKICWLKRANGLADADSHLPSDWMFIPYLHHVHLLEWWFYGWRIGCICVLWRCLTRHWWFCRSDIRKNCRFF